MKIISIKDLLDAGIHFGHRTNRWNPKMSEFIFGHRNGIHIIDLQQTLTFFNDALKVVEDFAKEGRFVGEDGKDSAATRADNTHHERANVDHRARVEGNCGPLGSLPVEHLAGHGRAQREGHHERQAGEEGNSLADVEHVVRHLRCCGLCRRQHQRVEGSTNVSQAARRRAVGILYEKEGAHRG